MKLKITFVLLIFISHLVSAQLSNAGDIAFIGFNADGDDDIAFVTFKDIPANSTIIFCDSEWNGTSFGTDEGDFTWSSGANSIPAGTVISINNISASISPSIGSITVNNAGGISATADAMFAFLGTSPRTVTTLLAAISNSSTGFGDLTNSGLTIGSTAILLPEGTDIANYNGPRTGLAMHDYLTAINTMSNWQTENTGANDSNNGTIPDLPFNSTTFNSTASDISFSTEFSIIDESNAGVDVVITLTNPSTGTTAVDVMVSTVLGTAANGSQYAFTNETVSFPVNSTQQTITIPITNDASFNGDSYFVLELANAVDGTISGISQKTIYILDDEESVPSTSTSLDINYLSSYLVDATGSAEIVAHDPVSQRLFVMNSTASKIEVLDFSNVSAITSIQSIDLSSYGIGGTSVAVKNGIVAATVESVNFANGKVIFMDINGTIGSVVEVGVLPDMITFSPDGTKVLTANEGQPNDDYTIDPEGSISIIDISSGFNAIQQSNVTTLNFNAFDSQLASLKTAGVRIYGVNASVSKDVEPEYITIADDGLTAWVTLQENNALAIINLVTNEITDIIPLGLKDHAISGNELDTSDQFGTIFMSNWPIKGMYMPDAIANYTVNGTTYLVTANEGDSRDYNGLSEETRINSNSYVLDDTVFPDASFYKNNKNLGRLTVTNATGDTDGDGDFDEIHVFGTRSFSIWNASTGALVYDSGSDFEKITAADPVFGSFFNASNDNNNLKNRSDNKGPEPEGITVAEINGATYAFITLERIGGLMTYDITNPMAPTFVSYKNSRSTTGVGGDLGPEGIIYITPENSPNTKGLVIMANEVSATLSIYEITNDVLSNPSFSQEKGFVAYPNPVKNGILHFNQTVTVGVFDSLGRKITEKENTKLLEMNYPKGIYFIKTKEGISQKVVVE
ncbi:choice-of-anchor I family protein [Flavobacterium sediminilitoris]|uniref:Choice-of-anchor I family protein n=1 Tax=Flavobacterium sediminilitoris TaxID=2024526 RepID=A0ABY4HLE9_9FLAO|nr:MULTISPECIES: choice-of-anchor I family protein [Flavobacterium]UOX32644.1 choice-of-anchor I family protein [Flavobacterium sediminilitoris]